MQQTLDLTIAFVKNTLADAEAGHDWFHIERVFKTAQTINQTEQANSLIVALAALLHDIADSKFNNGDEEIGPQKAGEFLTSINVDQEVINEVKLIIRHLSFKASFDKNSYQSKELNVVQDADRLDAIGAIGIARAFTYGGYKNRVLYNPEIKPNLNMTKEEYKNAVSPTLNHFYEKLLLLKDLMKTETGKKMAQQRHDFMLAYLEQFYAEWEGRK
ncbi:HD domain-containing protein [Pedobacter montanisoli]|uniref:HD domain-containing protein n=1 Tax=Pedobacter montanisoli TaxID=2923277 RepID=A0ABS9ZRY7_9SPHI|nr:HD domain-containing protein [Pedobacter montanisoli]MCJ0741351.1 HD domain-containing protein [Pedobacter montanisoli]